LNLRAHQSEIL
jgi:hypothetical protein